MTLWYFRRRRALVCAAEILSCDRDVGVVYVQLPMRQVEVFVFLSPLVFFAIAACGMGCDDGMRPNTGGERGDVP